MKKSNRYLLAVTVLCFLVSCATTNTNPREGGLFGYNPEAYEKRLQERRLRLKQLEEEQALQKQRSLSLEQEATLKQDIVAALKHQMDALNKDIQELEAIILKTQPHSQAQQQKLREINVKLNAVKAELNEVRTKNDSDIKTKEEEVAELNRKMDELFEEALAISKF